MKKEIPVLSRTKNSIYNIITNSFISIVSTGISFLSRFVFLKVLDATYLGVSGLFSNILLIFSLVELGIGAALTQMFYKPFAEKDSRQLSRVTHTTKLLLNIIGIIIILLTVIFTPFLQLFVNDMNAVPNMRLIFFLYGINSGITYFWGYFRTIITANQEAYKLTKIDLGGKIITFLGQSVVLIITRNFILYLVAQMILAVGKSLWTKWFVQKQISYIDYHCKSYVSLKEAKGLLKNVMGVSMDRVALVVTNGTDNILISKFLDLVTVGYASNYVMITQSVATLVESLFGPLLASIGNLCVSESNEKKYEYFNHFSFAAFWLYGFCSITAFCLSDIFIQMVFGSEYVIARLATFFLCFDIFCVGITRVSSLFRTAEGLFWQGKFRPLIQSIVNLIISYIWVKRTGALWVVYAGTVLSRLMVTVWYEPYIVLKYSMQKRPWKFYLKELAYFCVYFGAGISAFLCIRFILWNGILKLIVSGVICIFVINSFFALVFFRTNDFQYWYKFFVNLMNRKFLGKFKK